MMKKIIILISFIGLFVSVVGCTPKLDINNQESLLEIVKHEDEKANEIKKTETFLNYDMVLYTDRQGTLGMIIFKDDEFCHQTKVEGNKHFSTCHFSYEDKSMIVIYGEKQDNDFKYQYAIDGYIMEKELKDRYLIDFFVINSSSLIGKGEIIDSQGRIIDEF